MDKVQLESILTKKIYRKTSSQGIRKEPWIDHFTRNSEYLPSIKHEFIN